MPVEDVDGGVADRFADGDRVLLGFYLFYSIRRRECGAFRRPVAV